MGSGEWKMGGDADIPEVAEQWWPVMETMDFEFMGETRRRLYLRRDLDPDDMWRPCRPEFAEQDVHRITTQHGGGHRVRFGGKVWTAVEYEI